MSRSTRADVSRRYYGLYVTRNCSAWGYLFDFALFFVNRCTSLPLIRVKNAVFVVRRPEKWVKMSSNMWKTISTYPKNGNSLKNKGKSGVINCDFQFSTHLNHKFSTSSTYDLWKTFGKIR